MKNKKYGGFSHVEIKNKKYGGFSYVEIIVALGVFAILLAALLPLLVQIGRNIGFAQTYYRSQLLAQGMMLEARDTLLDGMPPPAAASAVSNYAAEYGVAFYRLWVFRGAENVLEDGNGPAVDIALPSPTMPVADGGYVVMVALFCEDGHMTGRAVGIANPESGDKV